MRSTIHPVPLVMIAALAVVLVSHAGCGGGSSPTAPDPVVPAESCLSRAVFAAPGDSAYCLPFPVGTSTTVTQTYCSPPGRSHEGRFAYDFECEIGDEILAAQDGVVFTIGEVWPDDDPTSGHENRVLIRQADGTMAFYAHFRQWSVFVNAGDTVSVGQLIGLCGTSGTPSHAHLHFEVFENAAYQWDEGVPVNFRNASGRLDVRGGLRLDETYRADPCDQG